MDKVKFESDFNVNGIFYESCGHKMRRLLEIKRVGMHCSKPDVIFVMMNPGSSVPMIENVVDEMVSAKPDKTQFQVMKVMNACLFDFARVINLSDLRTPDSKVLYSFLKSKQSSRVDHSIFSVQRMEELASVLENAPLVVFAWGLDRALTELAEDAIASLGGEQIVGLQKEGSDTGFRHPLPRTIAAQEQWVSGIVEQIKSGQRLRF